MKEETNENGTTQAPSEAQMNEMYGNARLNFHADAQEAKLGVNRRYAIMLETYGTYKKMPYGVKEMVKQEYAAYDAKWGENGEEHQKRFGLKSDESVVETKNQPQQEQPEVQTQLRQDFLQKMQQQRETQKSRNAEYEI